MTDQVFYDRMCQVVYDAYHASKNIPENNHVRQLIAGVVYFSIGKIQSKLDDILQAAEDYDHMRGDYYTDEQYASLCATETDKEYNELMEKFNKMDSKQNLIDEIYNDLYYAYGLNEIENEELNEYLETIVDDKVGELIDDIDQFCYEQKEREGR